MSVTCFLRRERPQRFFYRVERQADHVIIIPVDAVYGMKALVLNGIASGFVEGIARSNIGIDLLVAIIAHVNQRPHRLRELFALCAEFEQSKSRADDVRASAQ